MATGSGSMWTASIGERMLSASDIHGGIVTKHPLAWLFACFVTADLAVASLLTELIRSNKSRDNFVELQLIIVFVVTVPILTWIIVANGTLYTILHAEPPRRRLFQRKSLFTAWLGQLHHVRVGGFAFFAGAILGGVVNSLPLSTPETLGKMTEAERSQTSSHELGQLITTVAAYYAFFAWLALLIWSFHLVFDAATLLFRKRRHTLTDQNQVLLQLLPECRVMRLLNFHRLHLLIAVTLFTNYVLVFALGSLVYAIFW